MIRVPALPLSLFYVSTHAFKSLQILTAKMIGNLFVRLDFRSVFGSGSIRLVLLRIRKGGFQNPLHRLSPPSQLLPLLLMLYCGVEQTRFSFCGSRSIEIPSILYSISRSSQTFVENAIASEPQLESWPQGMSARKPGQVVATTERVGCSAPRTFSLSLSTTGPTRPSLRRVFAFVG